jgi:HAD superfamily hydrolase (TIGR01490 family)
MALILFDLDHTLLEGDCDQLWGDFLSDKNRVDPLSYQQQKNRFYQDYLDGRLDMLQFLSFCATALAQFAPRELQSLGSEFSEKWLKPRLRPKALETIELHKRQGDTLVIITATNRFLASHAAHLVGITHLIASELEQKEGYFTGNPLGTPCYREGKITRLNEWLQQHAFDLSEATFYSDSHNDLPLLKQVANPIAVTPDQQLAQYALHHHWTIVDWSYQP